MKDWISGSDPCSSKWMRVLCSDGRITGINLCGCGLVETLPSSLSLLIGLQSLFLPENQLSIPLPSLGNLATLQEISFSSNFFTVVPPNFFSGLQKISLDNNTFASWELPDSLLRQLPPRLHFHFKCLHFRREMRTDNLGEKNLMTAGRGILGSLTFPSTLAEIRNFYYSTAVPNDREVRLVPKCTERTRGKTSQLLLSRIKRASSHNRL